CQGMTFSTTLLSTLKAQYKIGVVEGVANIGGMKSRFTAIIHEHALHFLNNNNHDHQQPPTVSSDNHVQIDFPEIRCYGNYSIQQEQENKTKGHLNLRTKIDVLKLTITPDFLAQLVFVSKVIIHEINEILAKVSGFDQFHFGTTKHTRLSLSSKLSIIRIGSTNTENEDDDEPKKDQQTILSTLFTYTKHISMKGFEVMGQTPSNTIVKFENGDKKVPIFVKLTNYDEKNSLLFYNKPLINALFQDAAYFETKLLLKNSLQSDDPDKEAYFIRLTKSSFYWQPGAIDKGILFWLNYKNTFEYWNEQRGAFTTPTSDLTRLRSIVNVPTSPATKRELNFMFQLHAVDSENIDESEDDERIKRLEYEHIILGQKIETLKRSQTCYETLKPELARYEWLKKELLHTVKSEISQIMKKQSNKSGHNRDRNRIDSPSHKRTQSHDPSKPLHHTHSEMGGRPSSIHEDDIENGTIRAPNANIRFPSQDPSMFDDHQSITTNTSNKITSAPAVDLELNVQIQIADGSYNLYTSRDLISNSSFTTVNPTKQQQSQVNVGPSVDVDAHYNSKPNNTINSALNKRASFYCRTMIQSPTIQITIHPLLLDFLEQTLEHVTLPQEQDRQTNLQ
ncbi:unnamed protein product, partial [Adineta steineri]